MNIDNLSNEIYRQISEYSSEIEESLFDEIDDVAKAVKSDLENNSTIPQNTGKYKKSFYIKKIAEGTGYKRVVIANRKYQLTHLLEYGHLTRNGTGRTRAFPHWKQAEKLSQELYERMLKT